MVRETIIRNGDKDGDITLRSGSSHVFKLCLTDHEPKTRYSLYFTGESKFFSAWRDEIDFQHLYGLIDDSLNTDEAEGSRYCLDLSMKGGENYVKRAVKKIVWKPSLFDVHDLLDGERDAWDCGIYAKAKDLRIEKDGFLRMRFEIRNVREGVDNRFTDNEPDRVETIDIPEGSYDYRHLCSSFVFAADTTASVVVYLEGRGYSGNVYFERPHVISETGYNILPDFSTAVQNRPFFDWYGCNLSKREWPFFRITVNRKTVFEGNHFEAMHRLPSFEFDIPEGALFEGENTVEVEYRGEYREPAPFALHDIKIIEREGGALAVIGHGENAVLYREFPILVRTGRDNVKARFECAGGEIECPSELYFEKAGLHSVTVTPRVMKNGITFCFECEGERVPVTIHRVVRKEDDRVITGTGDAVYINFDSPEHFERYLEWYTENNIGQLLTLRPIYRWGGTRTLSEKSWRRAVELLDRMDYRYSMMSDGRDIPGYDKHPTPEMMNGRGFLGYQLHERDGQFFYWNYRAGRPIQNFQILDEFYDICMRMYRESPVSMHPVYKPCNVKMVDKKYSLRMDVDREYDSERLALGIENQLSDIKDHYTRHTGPAVNFRSFFKAGYSWVGAETMYASDEVQLAFLRGASRAYGRSSFGVHAAVQWSSRSHDCESRQRLYRLALYVPYICGATEINTEEGLYRIEAGYAGYDRFSQVCRDHLAQQRDFNRYVTSHTRRGELYSPMAFIYGRDDNFTGYYTSTNLICGRTDLPSGDLSKSWRLLNVMYPNSCIGNSRPYAIRADEKTYMYSETPYGNVDVAPVESDGLDRYRLISFAGFNRITDEDADKLVDYARRGGRVLMGWAHLSETRDYRDAVEGRLSFSDNAVASLFGGAPTFSEDSFEGKAIHASVTLAGYDRVIAKGDSGAPLAVAKRVVKGEIVLVNVLEYPGNDGVTELYKTVLEGLVKQVADEEYAWIEPSEGIEFSAYDDKYGARYFYLISTDILSDYSAEKTATLRVGSYRYEIRLPFGRLVKIAVCGDRAVWADNEDAELTVTEDRDVRVEGMGRTVVFAAKNGKVSQMTLDFNEASEITM